MTDKQDIWDQLEKVRDPEFGTPITEMHLTDEVKVDGGKVSVEYHLTAPMCPPPFALHIGQQIRRVLLQVEGVNSVNVHVNNHLHAKSINKRLRKGKK
ncbi:MAG: iron-sulfur cluster assembly protein [Candidatus Korarchaeota archaeon]|nr:iron-sulfur cluster assembly protein [Candidatus Korarchaeota archaeon]NIU82646.1 DUF59 domain-containing protein [Candidatus Thorarchaeota archaeon]NIW13127.1 DUF59 domain-containing protein [Candidatus Thorarchaeota archaeon]NIW51286.1 DUF59 domain-containing protein [Candidatus Korarchaeota archaeon]